MSFSQEELIRMKEQSDTFLELVEMSSHADLAQCTKLLAMYLTLYKQQFGEIPATNYQKQLHADELDKHLAKIVTDGMDEASEMLRIVLCEKQQDMQAEFIGNNYIN